MNYNKNYFLNEIYGEEMLLIDIILQFNRDLKLKLPKLNIYSSISIKIFKNAIKYKKEAIFFFKNDNSTFNDLCVILKINKLLFLEKINKNLIDAEEIIKNNDKIIKKYNLNKKTNKNKLCFHSQKKQKK